MFASEKSKIIATKSKNDALSILQICFRTSEDHDHWFELTNHNSNFMGRIYLKKAKSEEDLLKRGRPFTVEVDELKIPFCVSPVTNTFDNKKKVFLTFLGPVKQFHEAIHLCITSLYRPTPYNKYELTTNVDDLTCTPDIKNMKESYLATIKSESLNASTIDNFLSKKTSIEKLTLGMKVLDNFQEDSAIFRMKYFWFTYSLEHAPIVLSKFQGTHLWMTDANIKNEDIISFLNTWQNSECDRKIFEIKVSEGMNPLNPDIVYEDIDVSDWDPAERPKEFNFVSTFFPENFNKVYDCSTWMDIKRSGDGKIASICITSNAFKFLVWD